MENKEIYLLQFFTGQHNVALYTSFQKAVEALATVVDVYLKDFTDRRMIFRRIGNTWKLDLDAMAKANFPGDGIIPVFTDLENVYIVKHDLDPGNPFGVREQYEVVE